MDVVIIGRQTVGKDEGSLTLVDAGLPFLDKNNANPDHKIAIQPIVLKIVNSNGQDFPNGFIPDFDVNEISFLENLPPLGDPEEPMLAKALEFITGGSEMARLQAEAARVYSQMEYFKDSQDLQRYGQEQYILPDDLGKFDF